MRFHQADQEFQAKKVYEQWSWRLSQPAPPPCQFRKKAKFEIQRLQFYCLKSSLILLVLICKNTHTHTHCNIYIYIFNQINTFIASNPTEILQLIIFSWLVSLYLGQQHWIDIPEHPDVHITGFPFVWKGEVQGHCYGVFCKTYGIIAVLTTARAQKTNIFTNQGFHGDMVMQVWCYGGASVLT